MSFNNFPDYQSLESNSKGAAAKANRSIPDRIKDYGLMDYINSESRVLDLGCNRGYFGTLLSPHIKSYTGLDSDANQLKHAQKKPNMTFHNNKSFGVLIAPYDIILSLAFHSYVDMSMDEYGKFLDFSLSDEGYLFIEGHPPGYRGEPELYLEPLKKYLSTNFCIVQQRKVKDRELLRPFIIYKRMNGMVSNCIKIGDVIEKHYLPDNAGNRTRGIKSHWSQEIKALDKLSGLKHFPEVIEHGDGIIKMRFCGDRISKYNLPKDWKEQCKEINDTQKKHKLFHIDVKPKNICVLDGTIYLIDWGLWSTDVNKLQPIENVIKEL